MLRIFLTTISVVLLFLAFSCKNDPVIPHTTYLDSIPFDHIINPYGPPNRNLSFGNDTMNINGQRFLHGLGTHAPAMLNINPDGKALQFTVKVGIDREILSRFDKERQERINTFPKYVYDNNFDHYDKEAGGTVIFKILTDGKPVFESKPMTVDDDPLEIKVNLKRVKTLTLLAETTEDGSYNDHVNWADAHIDWKETPPDDIVIYRYSEDLLVNHIGFVPNGVKTCYLWGSNPEKFNLRDAKTNKVVFRGEMYPNPGVLGDYLVGDFSDYAIQGKYYIQSGNKKSEVFEIAPDVYLRALHLNINYINQQRSGHSTQGWAPGQHLDDGIRQDTWTHQDVTGGWYDGNDLRKATNGAALLLFALTNLAEAELPGFDKMELLDEIKWGNKFLHAMQEPEGYLMHYAGSTTDEWLDNRWTDNIVGNDDDRVILTRPAAFEDQMIFALSNAKIGYLYHDHDLEYSQLCTQKAILAWNWAFENQQFADAEDYGIAITAAIDLFMATGLENYKQQAGEFARLALAQQKDGDEYLSHHFFSFRKRARTYNGRWVIMGLNNYINAWPEDSISSMAKMAVEKFANGYYIPLSKLNAFNNIAWVFSTNDMESGKQIGDLNYRNFLHVGMNQHLASVGCALTAAYKQSRQMEHLSIAQRQIDWIYGANPFNTSTVTGLGYNQPALFKTSEEEFRPHTPEIQGGVMTGIGSNPNDKIALYPGWWWTTEYWSPTITYTILFTVMLQEVYQE